MEKIMLAKNSEEMNKVLKAFPFPAKTKRIDSANIGELFDPKQKIILETHGDVERICITSHTFIRPNNAPLLFNIYIVRKSLGFDMLYYSDDSGIEVQTVATQSPYIIYPNDYISIPGYGYFIHINRIFSLKH